MALAAAPTVGQVPFEPNDNPVEPRVDPLTVELWYLTAPGEASDALQAIAGGPSNQLGDRDEFIAAVAKLRNKQPLVEADHYRMASVDAQFTAIQIAERRPVVTNVAQSRAGVTRSIEFEDVGTIVSATPVCLANGRIKLSLKFEQSLLADSNLKMHEPTDGLAPVAAQGTTTTLVETVVTVSDGRPQCVAGIVTVGDRPTAKMLIVCASSTAG